MNIEKIHLKGFKSIASVSLINTAPFSAFAGANGSGKSNFADGLSFFGKVIQRGAIQALRDYGGYAHVHCYRHRAEKARTASLEIKISIEGQTHHYFIKLFDMDKLPTVEEKLEVDGKLIFHKKKGQPLSVNNANTEDEGEAKSFPGFPNEQSALVIFADSPIYSLLTNIKVFRFDPFAAKEPDDSTADATELDVRGRNVATLLSVLEKKPELREQILQWIELLIPSLEKITTKKQRLDGTTVITFKEEGLKTRFPAKLVSDGTIYTLCILTAMMSRTGKLGMTIIEEPERGIHPQAIAQLVKLMRDKAQCKHPVFITTHSESVIRSCLPEELWLANKAAGKTQLKHVSESNHDLGELNLDQAWLMNLFDGGLPW